MEEISRLKLEEYKKELQSLQESVPELVRKKQDARAEGDLRENTEYDIASTELTKTLMRITRLEEIMSDVKVIEPDHGQYITLGSFVEIFSEQCPDVGKLILRLDNEGNILAEEEYNQVLSIHSTLGTAILNGTSGIYTVQTESGQIQWNVRKVPFEEIAKRFNLPEF